MPAANKRAVFDVHVHIERGMDDYDLPLTGKNVIFNQVESYKANKDKFVTKNDSVTLIVDMGDGFDFVKSEAEQGRLNALKIHTRVQKISEGDYDKLKLRLSSLPANLPIVIDAFYYGKEMQYQPILPKIVELIESFADRQFVIAHMGGYKLLEYFFHLREFTNCYYDLSFALQYFEDSSLMQDLQKFIRYTDKSKIMYGSDYPYAKARHQCDILLGICQDLTLSETDTAAILNDNARQLYVREGVRERA